MAGFLPWMFHLVLIFWLIRHNSCAKLSYANCSEVEAAEPSVIKGIPYKFFCNCSHIEDVNCKGYQSCSQLLAAGFKESGYYEIDPDGPGTGVAGFLVFCDMCTPTELSGCISGYSSFQKSCYKLYTDLKDKHNASAECAKIKKGNHLVDITSQEEQDFVAHMLFDVGSSDVWLGLTVSGTGEPLYWSDGIPLEYDAWTTVGRNEGSTSGSTCVKMNSKHNYKWADHDCSIKYRYVCEYEVCRHKLGLEDGKSIKDDQINASSETDFRAHHGRLNGAKCWLPSLSRDSWIQVTFSKSMRISGIITQGCGDISRRWIKTLRVQYTNDKDDQFHSINETFEGNTDASTPKIILFKDTIDAVVLRVVPLTYHSAVGMRWEILGCQIETQGTESHPSPTCRGTTVIDHEQTRSSDLLEVKTIPGEVIIPITYKPSLEQISALVSASDSCQQYIQYMHDSAHWDEIDWPYVWWKSRQGRDIFNFGELPAGSEKSTNKLQNTYGCPSSVQLGVEDGRISDSAITVSSKLDQDHDAAQGRLNYKQPTENGSDSWIAEKDDPTPWIQVEFSQLTWVSGVMLQGMGDADQWVKTYSVEYKRYDLTWTQVEDEQNQEKIFTGNNDSNTIVTSMFPSRVLAKAVKILPKSNHGHHFGLRFELLGCRLDDCLTSEQLGVEDGSIADSAITASTEWDDNHSATQGRLNHIQPTALGSDSWMAHKNDPTPWIQAAFSELTWVSGVMLQGRADYSSGIWVKTYTVKYQIYDDQNWIPIVNEKSTDFNFTGNTDKNSIVTSMFPSRVLAKAVRIYPQTWHSVYVGLRFELLGCRPGCTTPDNQCGLNSIWKKDAGYLTDRGQLPMTALRYGGNDKSKYSIGPLVCNGTRSLPKRPCAELWSDGVRIDMEYEIDPDGPDGIGPPFTVFCNLSQAAPILRSCEELRLAGYTTNGYYDIDPDGPDNGELPFTVFCVINETDARTRIHHDSESKRRVIGYKDPGDFVLSPNYMAWSPEQMRNLIGVSMRCFQDIKYHCYNSRLFKSNNATDAEAWWISGDNGKMVNWGGVPTGKFGCSCSQSDPNTCIDNNDACNCDDDDDSTWREDGGSLTDKDTLPVMKMYLGTTESPRQGYHVLGPLICLGKNDTYPLYRTCGELVCAGHRRNGYYLLDSDGTNTGDAPYVAYCDMDTNGVTILTHNYSSSIDMKSPSDIVVPVNYAATTNQLKALASLSGSCRQHLNFSCKQFPIWGSGLHLSWNSVNGQKMNNWGGVPTKNYGCACMDNDECSSSGKYCNCDKDDDTLRVDEGWIKDKQVLPVTSLNAKRTKNTNSVGIVTLGSFECEGSDLPSPLRTCDEYMDAGFGSGWYQIDPDGPEGNLAAFTVHCNKGKTVIHHDTEERRLATGNGDTSDPSQTVKRDVKYGATMEQIQALIDASHSCRQFIKWECHGSTIEDSHWVSRDDKEMHPDCSCGLGDACDEQDKQCNCLKNDFVWRSDEGYLSDKSKLPVSKLVIGDIDGMDEFVYYTLGPLECFKKNQVVLQSCDQLRLYGSTSGYYDIDPDGTDDGVEPFAVYCNMTDGSTIIGHNREEKTLVRDTMKEDIDIEYTATLDQIQALINISSHCQQHLSYECHKSGLFGSDLQHVAFWKHAKADDKQYNFGGVDMGLLGCPCGFDGSCGNANICICDNKLGEWKSDSGLITNRNQLPVVFMRFGDTDANKQKGFYTLGKLQCSNKVFASCAELRDSGYLTDGYYPINSELRFCKMTSQGACPVYRTGPNFLYQYRFPELPDHVSSFEFSVDAQSNVFIALSTQPTQPTGLTSNSDEMYQIEIKPGRVDQVRLKLCLPICLSKDPHDVPNLLNDAGLTHFYINWTDGLIEVGHKGKAPILSYTDPSPIQQIKYVGFSSGSDQEAEWRFHEYLCNGFRKLVLRANIVIVISHFRSEQVECSYLFNYPNNSIFTIFKSGYESIFQISFILSSYIFLYVY